MTTEEKVLLKLVAAAINGNPVVLTENEKTADWKIILEEAVAQAVVLSAFDVAAQIRDIIPSSLYEQWETMAYKLAANNIRVEMNQQELVGILSEGDYRYAIIKGESAAAYYRKPEIRQLGDVDFLIDPSQKGELRALFEENGYTASMDTHICHIVLRKPGAHLEMHFEPAGIPNGKAGELVREMLKGAVYTTIETTSNGISFAMLSQPLHGLVLLLHMQHHILNEGIGLRHLCDWACFVKETAAEPFWQENLIPRLKEIGLHTFAAVMTQMSCMFFEIEEPLWLEKQSEDLCSEMLLDIFGGGNFGRKDKVRDQSGVIISNRGKDGTERSGLYYAFYKFKEGYKNKSAVWEKYPSSRKYPLLYPFFYFCRFASRLNNVFIKEKIPVTKILSQAEQRKEIYDKLHIFEVKK